APRIVSHSFSAALPIRWHSGSGAVRALIRFTARTSTTGVIMSRRTRTAGRRAWYSARPLFDALADLAGLNSAARTKPIFPQARLELNRLERREVVSETLSYLLGGFGLMPTDESLAGARPEPVVVTH